MNGQPRGHHFERPAFTAFTKTVKFGGMVVSEDLFQLAVDKTIYRWQMKRQIDTAMRARQRRGMR